MHKDTPREVVTKFAKAFETGDVEGVKAVSISNPQMDKALPIFLPVLAAMKKLQDAAAEKFGAESKTVMGSMDKIGDFSKNIAEGEIKENGETATLTVKDAKEPLILKRVNDNWKVDLASLKMNVTDEEIARQTPIMQAMAKAALESADEIKAGKYKTAKEAKDAFEAKGRAMRESLSPKK